jgi:hypothetical protein
MHLIKVESKQHYLQSLENKTSIDQVIIVEEIKMNLLSKSCLALGIITFLSNLTSSASEEMEIEEEAKSDPQDWETWKKRYIEGMGHEVYRSKLSPKFENKNFTEVARQVY